MTPFFGLLRFTVHEEDNHHKNSGRRRVVQLTLQDTLDNRRFQVEKPSLGFGSSITKERKQNEHDQTASQAPPHMGAVLLPWEALYEFGRMICLGFAATFGGAPSAGKTRHLQPNLNEPAGRQSIQSGNTWSSL
jgi:hypothetical protein